MKMKEVYKTSITILLLRRLCGYYFYLDNKIENIYHESHVSRILSYTKGRMLLSFRFSYCRMFVDVIERASPVVLYDSIFGRRIINLYKKSQNRISNYLKTSLFESWSGAVKKEFSLYSLKAVSVILILAVVINLVLSVIFGSVLGLPRIVVLSSFLIIAVMGLLCDVNWPTIKRGSVILRILLQ